jgi:hypothetical protein
MLSTSGTPVSTNGAEPTPVLPNAAGDYYRELRIIHTGDEDFLLSTDGHEPAAWEFIPGEMLEIVRDYRQTGKNISVYIKRIGEIDVTGIHAAAGFIFSCFPTSTGSAADRSMKRDRPPAIIPDKSHTTLTLEQSNFCCSARSERLVDSALGSRFLDHSTTACLPKSFIMA